jgi:hypothetical protein
MYFHVKFVISDEVSNENAKETIRAKCKQYLDRAEQIRDHIQNLNNNTSKGKPVKARDSGKCV